MYLLFVDESGTHGDAHAFVLGAIAVHENDAARLQKVLDDLITAHLGRVPVNLEEYELHAVELRNAKKARAGSTQRVSIWAALPRSMRLGLLDAAYKAIMSFVPADPDQPTWLFGTVLDQKFRSADPQTSRERFAYEVLLNKFDLMLKKVRQETGKSNRGLVIHDRRLVAEHDIQAWTTQWRAAAGDVGQLRNLADVPLFTDSRATRILQAADLVSYALYRRYGNPSDSRYFDLIWPGFHRDQGQVHGVVHFTPRYGSGSCTCEPCIARSHETSHV
jgi:Protein of unknown function (DUF3800)